MAETTGAQALVNQLRAEGVDSVFALPGVQIMPAFDALYEQRDAIRLVHTRHEQATSYMADGYARVTGKVGVAMVVPGPGALNATAGIGTAYAASCPVLLISGQIDSQAIGKRRGELHEVDEQLDVFRPLTKWVHRVMHMEEIPAAVHEAFRQLKSGRPRPVELEVPPDVLMARGRSDIIPAEDYAAAPADAEDIEAAARLLATAEKPAIIAGGGVITAGATAELRELAEFLQAPVIVTPQGKGAISDDHPLHLAVNYLLSPIEELLSQSDLVLAVGTRLLLRNVPASVMPKLVHLDIDGSEIGKAYPTEVGIEADAKEGLARLLGRLGALGPPMAPRGEEISGWRKAFRQQLREMAPQQSRLVDVLHQELDDDAVLLSGVTNIGYWSVISYPTRRPRSFITSSYFGTLGYAFPTALGAKLACPERQVVALCGDGGFLYGAAELSTALRYGLDVVAVVFNNHAYGASRWDQTHRFDERYIGTDLRNPDFMKLAEAFGVVGLRCDADGFAPALRKALSAGAPVLLEVEVPIMMPPFQVV